MTSEPAGELPQTWPNAEGMIIQAPSPSSLDSESRARSGSSHASYKIHSKLKACLNAAYSAFSNHGPGNAGAPETLGKQRTPTLTPCGSGAAVPHPVQGEAQQPLLPPPLGTGARGTAGRPRGAGHTQGWWDGGLPQRTQTAGRRASDHSGCFVGAAGGLPRAESEPAQSEARSANMHMV